MDWQQIAALTVVATTTALFVRARARNHAKVSGLEKHCGCGGGPGSEVPATTVLRGRKGERAQLVVKLK
jgi:hypothetical protein